MAMGTNSPCACFIKGGKCKNLEGRANKWKACKEAIKGKLATDALWQSVGRFFDTAYPSRACKDQNGKAPSSRAGDSCVRGDALPTLVTNPVLRPASVFDSQDVDMTDHDILCDALTTLPRPASRRLVGVM